jgi:hypothetical protein
MLPPPDTREGAVIALATTFGLVYILLLVAQYNAMTGLAFVVTTFSLLASLIAAFALSGALGADIATYQRLELELARTVLAYVGTGTPPPSDAPLAGVWRAHVAAAEESRRMARAHAYALGLFTGAGVLSLAAVLLAGLGTVVHVQDVLGLGMFVEWFAFTFLIAGAASTLISVGYASPVPFYERLAPRRWHRNAGRQHAVEGAVSEVGWLSEFARGARESRISPAGRSMIPSWQE